MPIYEYKCKDCDHRMEALQKMSDPKLVDCPACEAPALVKQVTAAAFKLNGTGWYETDFKNSGAKPQAAASDPAKGSDATKVPESKNASSEPASATKSDSTSDSKPSAAASAT